MVHSAHCKFAGREQREKTACSTSKQLDAGTQCHLPQNIELVDWARMFSREIVSLPDRFVKLILIWLVAKTVVTWNIVNTDRHTSPAFTSYMPLKVQHFCLIKTLQSLFYLFAKLWQAYRQLKHHYFIKYLQGSNNIKYLPHRHQFITLQCLPLVILLINKVPLVVIYIHCYQGVKVFICL